MAVPWNTTLWMAKMVWVALTGWIMACLAVADEIASSLRAGDIGPFHVMMWLWKENTYLFHDLILVAHSIHASP
ncbi:hypothetical protein RJ639_044866 [Escallonia herrerae]|uniref:Uncharacterized protein n=1 Tax=Escallonia herrerae TaxID=1293975 RepID=A0AA88WCB2_9ASTE|nr:hypothetical protein RJ639_044866 [Escallonia herrerae]